MQGNVDIKSNEDGTIEILGTRYVTEKYCEEMTRRWYSKGYNEGLRKPVIHIAQYEQINETEQ